MHTAAGLYHHHNWHTGRTDVFEKNVRIECTLVANATDIKFGSCSPRPLIYRYLKPFKSPATFDVVESQVQALLLLLQYPFTVEDNFEVSGTSRLIGTSCALMSGCTACWGLVFDIAQKSAPPHIHMPAPCSPLNNSLVKKFTHPWQPSRLEREGEGENFILDGWNSVCHQQDILSRQAIS